MSETSRTFAAWLAIATVFALAACSRSEPRQPFSGVTSIDVTSFVSGSSARIAESSRVAALVIELNSARAVGWSEFRGKVGPCSTVITLLQENREVGKLFVLVNPLTLVELPGKAEHTGFYVEPPSGTAPLLELAVSEVPLSSNCNVK